MESSARHLLSKKQVLDRTSAIMHRFARAHGSIQILYAEPNEARHDRRRHHERRHERQPEFPMGFGKFHMQPAED